MLERTLNGDIVIETSQGSRTNLSQSFVEEIFREEMIKKTKEFLLQNETINQYFNEYALDMNIAAEWFLAEAESLVNQNLTVLLRLTLYDIAEDEDENDIVYESLLK